MALAPAKCLSSTIERGALFHLLLNIKEHAQSRHAEVSPVQNDNIDKTNQDLNPRVNFLIFKSN